MREHWEGSYPRGQQSIGVWNYSKQIIDQRRAAGLKPGQTEFSAL